MASLKFLNFKLAMFKNLPYDLPNDYIAIKSAHIYLKKKKEKKKKKQFGCLMLSM